MIRIFLLVLLLMAFLIVAVSAWLIFFRGEGDTELYFWMMAGIVLSVWWAVNLALES